jgi:hypothetical protein
MKAENMKAASYNSYLHVEETVQLYENYELSCRLFKIMELPQSERILI